MFNNTALDIAIGLVFIYLLYSLLATTVNEFIAAFFSYRGRMLERGIEQMLDGENHSYYWWNKLVNFFIWLTTGPKGYVISSRVNPPDEKATTSHKISFSDFVSNKKIKDPTGDNIKRSMINKKADLYAMNVVNHTLYKRSAEKSTFSKKPAYLPSDVFSDIMTDLLSGGKASNGDTVLLSDIKTYVNDTTNTSLNPGLKKILNIYLEQANGDLQRFRLLMENWYNDTMDRVSGWYKKQASRILLYLGFLMAMAFNVNTIDIAGKLSKDKKAREALVQNASKYVDTHIDTMKTIALKKDTSKNPDSAFAIMRQGLDSMKAFYHNEIAENDTLIGLGWGDYGYAAAKKKAEEDYRKLMDSFPMVCAKLANAKIFKELNVKNIKISRPAPPADPSQDWLDKVKYVLFKTFLSPHMLLGFLITGLAISLGAPFWFDLLNRFINLRVTGAKPDSAKSSTPISKTSLLNQKPDRGAKG